MLHTIEVLFQPEASSYGHLLVRVGDRMFDYGNPMSLRDQDFASAMRFVRSPMYGFVLESTAERVDEVQAAFRELIASRPAFSSSGGGDSYSCASFVTSILKDFAPELRIDRSVSAVGVARRMLNRSDVGAIALYGRAAEDAASERFTFAKLE
jgi:hypothetical protein